MMKKGEVIGKGSRIKNNSSIFLPISARILNKELQAFGMQIGEVSKDPELEHPKGTSLVNVKRFLTKLGACSINMA